MGGTPLAVTAVVELEEGLRVLARLVGVGSGVGQELVGMPVEAVFGEADDRTPEPRFRLVSHARPQT